MDGNFKVSPIIFLQLHVIRAKLDDGAISCVSLQHCCRLTFGICEKFRLIKIVLYLFSLTKLFYPFYPFSCYRGESLTLSVKNSFDSCLVYSFRMHLIYSFISPLAVQEIIYLLLLVHSLSKDTPITYFHTSNIKMKMFY